MRFFSRHIVISTLLALLIRESYGLGWQKWGVFDVVINENDRILMNIHGSDSQIVKLSQDRRHIQSAYVDRLVNGHLYEAAKFKGNVACFFYQPAAIEKDRLVSPLFQLHQDKFKPDYHINLVPEEPFMADYVSCFYSIFNVLPPRKDEVVVLLDYGSGASDADPRLVRLKKNPTRFVGWRIWDERRKHKLLGRPIYGPPNAVQRSVNGNFGTTLGSPPKRIGKAVLIWPERDSITCYLVKSDESSQPAPFTADSPLMSATTDVVGVSCAEFEG